MKPLFIPLNRKFFEAFERGEKAFEYRRLGPRWNERTCVVGRAVVLSLGYGKARRLRGVIVSFASDAFPERLPGWMECYGSTRSGGTAAACIGIKVEGSA